MKELGIDTLNNSKVIIARERTKRPLDKMNSKGNKTIENNEYSKLCPFCRENEDNISDETYVINKNNKWVVKSVKNKYPIIDENPLNEIKGEHEVIIDTYKHNGNFYNMIEEEFYNLLLMYKIRFKSLKKDENIKYICLFKNYLRESGASLMHPHSQILSLPFIPPDLKNEYKVSEEFYEKMGINMYNHLIIQEIGNKKRVIHDSSNFLVFVPEICRFTGDTVILFKDNTYFYDLNDDNLKELSIILKKLFEKIYEEYGNCPFNLYLHTHPVNIEKDYKDKYNVHIHIVPRRFNFGGFELSTGMYVSSIESEDIANRLKFD